MTVKAILGAVLGKALSWMWSCVRERGRLLWKGNGHLPDIFAADARSLSYTGVLNYRTGELDDGTDPHGWY